MYLNTIFFKNQGDKIYLYLIGIYIIFVFNEFLAKPIDFYALALIIIGIPLIKRCNAKVITDSIRQSKSALTIYVSIFFLSVLFFVATLLQLPRTNGLISFFAQYGVHMAIPAIAMLVIPLNLYSARFIFKCLLVALLMLALNDIALYIWQALKGQRLGMDYSHRWFGDGYVFLLPFLLLRLLDNKKCSNHQRRFYNNFFQIGLYILLLVVIVLAGGTGARSTYGIVILQLVIFCHFKCQQFRVGRANTILLITALVLLVVNFLYGLLAPDLLSGALDRGAKIQDRIEHTWGPGIFFISQSPIIGYGFGSTAWDESFSLYGLNNSNTLNIGSPHNWFLAAGFFGGLFAICAQLVMIIGVIYWSYCSIKNNNQETIYWTLGLLGGFISFYLFKGMVEFSIYKYLSITLIGIFILNAINFQNKVDYLKSETIKRSLSNY